MSQASDRESNTIEYVIRPPVMLLDLVDVDRRVVASSEGK
jgi:hypothetical protein